MPLSSLQLALHWREFAAAKRACAAAGHPEPDRHALYTQALGKDKSLTKFNNGDLDKVLAVFRALSQPANFDAQVDATQQPRIRLEHSIRELASQITGNPVHIADSYWQAVYRDKFWHGGLCPDNPGQPPELALLSVPQLTQLRDTLDRRLASKRRKETMSISSASNEELKLDMADDNVPF
jgi:hypothetical protein